MSTLFIDIIYMLSADRRHQAAGSAICSPAGPMKLDGSVIAFIDDPGDGCGIELDQRSKERGRSRAQAGPLPALVDSA
jgi:hypothetical protein